MPVNNSYVSAVSIIDQFKLAKEEIMKDNSVGYLWAPILPVYGPGLLVQAQKAIDYSEQLVEDWLKRYMLRETSTEGIEKTVAEYFCSHEGNKDHGRRIDKVEAISAGLNIENLEGDQAFQEAILTNYHLLTILFEKTPVSKIVANQLGINWVKNFTNPSPSA